jgi:hypothetical protein
LVPEIWGAVPLVVKVVLAIVAERAPAAPRAEGLSGDLIAVVAVFGVKAPQEVAAEDTNKK